MKKSFFTLLIGCLFYQLQAQDTREAYQVRIQKSIDQIELDGDLSEESWSNADIANNFINHWPLDSGKAEALTEVKLTYDDAFLYVAATCFDNGERIIQSLRRDSENHWSSDGFTIAIDPINQRTNGFLFGVNAGGAQIEGTLNVRGSDTESDNNWDNKWYSQVKQYEDRYVVEMAIPFKTLRYNGGNGAWGVNFIRNDMQRNIYSTWTRFPLNFGGIDLGYNGSIVWDKPPQPSEGKVILIPYTSGGISRNHEDNEPTERDFDAGLDAKIALSSSLNLDLTLNPDFSNVDVDQQVTNLTRFSVLFPERRNFFLENSDLFGNFGAWNVRPFFSRRIGLIDGEPVPILYGARLSGNITDDTRIGIMDVQTRSTNEVGAQNYAVLSAQKRVLKRSNIKGIFINRQSTESGESNDDMSDYNRVGGLEFEYLSSDGKWSGTARYHKSFNPEKYDQTDFYSAFIAHNSRNLWFGTAMNRVQENFIADVGFVPRLFNNDDARDTTVRIGYTQLNHWLGYNHFTSQDSKINFHGPRYWTALIYNDGGEFSERRSNLRYFLNFSSASEIEFRFIDSEIVLPFPTDFVGEDNDLLPSGRYRFQTYGIRYASNPRKAFYGEVSLDVGSFYNGNRTTFGLNANIRRQPWGNFGLAYTQNRVELSENFGSTVLHLIGPRMEVSFSNKMFWTSFLQYNTQAENFNINSRFQWRYKPMSDLFIVYSDNYATDGLNVKNRGIVFKLTYWLNL